MPIEARSNVSDAQHARALRGRHGTSEGSRPPGLGKLINCLRRRRRRSRAPTAPAAPAPPSHRKPNNRTTEQPNRPSPPSPSRVEPAYSGRKRPPMHPTRLRCCCSTSSRFCALYFAAAAPHQRGPLRHLRAASAPLPASPTHGDAPLLRMYSVPRFRAPDVHTT